MKKGLLVFVGMFFFLFSGSLTSALTIASDGFEDGWNGGSGLWNGGWYHSGDSAIVTTDLPHEGTRHVQLRRGNGYMDRNVNLAGQTDAKLKFYAKVNSFEAKDHAILQVSSDGNNWHELKRFTLNDSDNQYHLYDFDLTQYGLTSGFYVSVDAQMSGTDDYLFLDEIEFYNSQIQNQTNQTNTSASQPSWHIQFNPTPAPQSDVQYWSLDLFDVPAESMQMLRANGTFVMCYFSAGSWEDWRADASQFPSEVLGNNLAGWPGEKYLDIRSPVVRELMAARMDLGIQKGCSGFDPDNMDSYLANSGFPLTEQDAIDYYNFLANYAHSRNASIGLKNALLLIPSLIRNMDWAMNEQCFYYNECGLLQPVLDAGKPVFQIEYGNEQRAREVCAQSKALGFSTLIKNRQLDSWEISCLAYGGESQDIASDGFEDGWAGGFGLWNDGWYHEGDSKIISTDLPYEGKSHLRLRAKTGYVDRPINLQGRTSAHLSFYAKVNSYESADSTILKVSSDGVNWYVLKTFTPADSDNQYHLYNFDLTQYGLTSGFWIAIDSEASANNDYLYLDAIRIY